MPGDPVIELEAAIALAGVGNPTGALRVLLGAARSWLALINDPDLSTCPICGCDTSDDPWKREVPDARHP